MVAPFHAGKLCLRHVAGDASASFALRFMVRMCSWIFHMLLVARHACVIKLLLLEAVTTARRMAVHAFELPCFHARAHHPERIGIILSQIPAVGIEVRVFECCKIKVVEVPVAGSEACCNRPPLV